MFQPRTARKGQCYCSQPCRNKRSNLFKKRPKKPTRIVSLKALFKLNEPKTETETKHKKEPKQPAQPKPKPEFTINLYQCQKCKKKVPAKIVSEKKGRTQILELYCSVCGDKIFNCTFQRTTKDKPNEYVDSKSNPENLLEIEKDD